MRQEDHIRFELLKQKIVETMQRSYPGINPSIEEWKGQEITDFQEDLLAKVNTSLSEKWFYTHFKSSHSKLPRVDVLNLLSRYAGYANWDDFIFRNKEHMPVAFSPARSNRFFLFVPVLVLLVMAIFYGIFKLMGTREYRICFFDSVTREPITGQPIEVKLLEDDQSPESHFCDDNGCLELKTNRRFIRIVVSSPYYQPDTIGRILEKWDREQLIGLRADDYALVLHYFSQTKMEDWAKRRAMLDSMIDERAMIYQVHPGPGNPGMELFNKWEFIDRLTVPAGSLGRIEVLDTKYSGEKLMVLRFMVKEKP